MASKRQKGSSSRNEGSFPWQSQGGSSTRKETVYQRSDLSSYRGDGSGNLKVTPEMSKIILQAGYLSTTVGGQTLRNLYFDGSSSFEASKLTPFGFYCYLGEVDLVKQAVESGNAPDIEGTETPYEFGYITLTVSGGQRVQTYGKKRQARRDAPIPLLRRRSSRPAGYCGLHGAPARHDESYGSHRSGENTYRGRTCGRKSP